MDEVRRARARLGIAVVGVVLLAVALVAGALRGTQGGRTEVAPAVPQPTAEAPTSDPGTTVQAVTPAAWSRPTTRDPATFAVAFAAAIWTYDARQPYDRWAEAIGGWADPLGSPASASVARGMLPPPPAYEDLRGQGVTASATVTSPTIPAAASALAAQAPTGWHAFVVRGTQHLVTRSGRYDVERQVAVAVVCKPTCWLWSATPEVGA